MHVDPREISPVAQDYLKVIWSATEWGESPITTKALAARFGTSQAAVSDTMKRLMTQGLVEYEPYRPVTLTDRGRDFALAMVRRHRLIETFLVEVLGFGWDEVHEEAELLEHAATERLIERIDVLLGHPTADPHGDPIPGPDLAISHPAGARNLEDMAPGTYVVVRISDADPVVLEELAQSGVGVDSVVVKAPDEQVTGRETGARLSTAAVAAIMARRTR